MSCPSVVKLPFLYTLLILTSFSGPKLCNLFQNALILVWLEFLILEKYNWLYRLSVCLTFYQKLFEIQETYISDPQTLLVYISIQDNYTE